MRQNFLSKASFVDVAEIQVLETIRSLPALIPSIKLLSEHIPLQSMRFSYELPEVKKFVRAKDKVAGEYVIDVTVLPLNKDYTRISLHAAYRNGQVFYQDPNIALALHDFEQVIQSAMRGEINTFHSSATDQSSPKIFQLFSQIRTSIPVFFMKRKAV